MTITLVPSGPPFIAQFLVFENAYFGTVMNLVATLTVDTEVLKSQSNGTGWITFNTQKFPTNFSALLQIVDDRFQF